MLGTWNEETLVYEGGISPVKVAFGLATGLSALLIWEFINLLRKG